MILANAKTRIDLPNLADIRAVPEVAALIAALDGILKLHITHHNEPPHATARAALAAINQET